MATSGGKSVTVTSWDTLKFSWWVVSTNYSNSTSTIGWKMELVAGSSGRISSTASKKWSVIVGTQEFSGSNTIGIENNRTKTLASGQATIKHAYDGTASFTYYFSQEFAITFSGSNIGTKSGSGTGTLDRINTATEPKISTNTVYMGEVIVINLPRENHLFTHTLDYRIAGTSAWVNIAKDVGTYYEWRTPDIATTAPNAAYKEVELRCSTVYEGATIGAPVFACKLLVPEKYKPTASLAITDTSGIFDEYGVYLSGRSTLSMKITAAGAGGSTIKSYKTTVNGVIYTGSSFTATAKSSTHINTTVTDSRGREYSFYTFVKVLEYSKPVISELQAWRVNTEGAAEPSGENIAVNYIYSMPELDGANTSTMVLEYKRSIDETWEQLLTSSDLSADTTITPSSPTFSEDYQYDIRLSVTDAFAATATYTVQLPSAKVIMDIKADGLGIGIGKTAEIPGLDIGWDVTFRKGMSTGAGGWEELTLDAAFRPYEDNAANTPVYKASGQVVTVRGVVSPQAEYASTNTPVVIATGIPEGLRPPATLQFVCQGSGMNRWCCAVTAGGTVTIARYGITDAATVPVTAWLTFAVTYQI